MRRPMAWLFLHLETGCQSESVIYSTMVPVVLEVEVEVVAVAVVTAAAEAAKGMALQS